MRLHRHGTCEQLHRVSGGRREKILKIRVDSERGKRNIPGAEVAVNENATLSLGYGGLLSQNHQDNSVNAGFTWRF